MSLFDIPANPVPEGAVAGTLKTRDGVELRYARWAPPPGAANTGRATNAGLRRSA
jgi:lysophospholipase